MKKLIAIILIAVFALSFASCADTSKPANTDAKTENITEKATEAPATEAPATDAPATDAPATEAPVTDAPATEAPVTEAPVTDAPATEAPATEAPVTDAPATEAPATEAPVTDAPATEAPATEAPVTDAPATEAPSEIPDNAYFFDAIYILPPDNYTMKDFSGVPSGLKNGVTEGTCFFNFQVSPPSPGHPLEEADAKAFLAPLAPCDITITSYSKYEVDGCTVVKVDYIWETNTIIQSYVRVYLDGYDVIILFAALTDIPEAQSEFDAIISTLGIVR